MKRLRLVIMSISNSRASISIIATSAVYASISHQSIPRHAYARRTPALRQSIFIAFQPPSSSFTRIRVNNVTLQVSPSGNVVASTKSLNVVPGSYWDRTVIVLRIWPSTRANSAFYPERGGKLVPAKGQYFAAGKVTVGFTSHLPCVKTICGISIPRFKGLMNGNKQPTPTLL